MELSFYYFLQNYFWDRKTFVLIFFLSATVGITLSYITNRFSSLLFLPFTMKANTLKGFDYVWFVSLFTF